MNRVLNILFYGKYNKRTYNNYKDVIDKNNVKSLNLLCYINLVLSLVFSLTLFFTKSIIMHYSLVTVFLSIIYIFLLRTNMKEKYITVMFYIYFIITVSIYKILGVNYNIDQMLSIMAMMYIVNVVMFIDRPFRYNTVMFIFTLGLCFYTILSETNNYVIVNCIIYVFAYFIGCIISYFQFNDIIEKAKIIHKIQKERDLDNLTKLYNKLSLERNVNEFLSNDNNKGVMFIFDLDNFKEVNDKYGHIAGDELLINVGDIIRKTFRKGDCISRFGGDEFCIFIEDIVSENFATNKSEKLINEIKDIKFEGKNLVSCSIGIAFSEAKDDFNSLFKKADEAMYEAKSAGKSCYKFYELKK